MVNAVIPPTIHEWLHPVFARIPLSWRINFWGQTEWDFADNESPPITVHIHHPGVLKNLFLSRDPLTLVDAYLQKWIDVEGDLAAVVPVVQRYSEVKINRWQALRAWLASWRWPNLPHPVQTRLPWQRLKFRTLERDRVTVQHHYDTGNTFYKQWLDPHLVYSCAYFEQPQMTLKAAQEAKLDRICRKLKLSPGETLLDIGCGWGSLMHWAVTHYGVKAHGITLSEEQLAYNRERIVDAGLDDQITVELLDYRDLPTTPTFDKVVSVGMVEHVGAENYPVYFQRALAVLKPGGLFLNHGISTRDRWQYTRLGERFMDRYIFPDGHLTRISTQLAAAEAAGWEIVDVDAWRPHYAKTLQCWAENFDAVFDEVAQHIGERRAQIWRLYLIGCALGFANNAMGIYQTLLRRSADVRWDLPMVREGWLC